MILEIVLPQYLLFDFENTYKVASDKLLVKWPGYSDKFGKICQLHRVDDNFATMWPRDVEKFLMLLKLLPAVASGQKTSSVGIETFNNSIDRLIVFQQVYSHDFSTCIRSYR